MKRFRKITALFLTLLIAFSFWGVQNVYAVTEMSAEEQARIISIFGELPPERSENKTFAQRVAELFSTRAATISDGVYYIKNNATGFYLNVADDSPEETAQVEVTGKCTVNPSGNNPNKLTQLWRVTRVSGGYILRPLHMLNLTFAAHTRNNIIAMTYYDTNSNVVMYGKWDIDGSINDCNIVDTTFSKAVTLDADYNIAFTDDQYDDNASWSFEPATNIPSGVIVYNSKIRYNLGETSIITASAYSPTLQFGTVTWSTANSSIASLSQISSDGTQKKVVRRSVKGSGTGVTSLTMTCATDSSIKTTYYVAVNQLADGQYSIRNAENNMYADIENSSTNSNANLKQQTGTANNSQFWNIKFHSDDGYFTIQSEHSSHYMTVKNNSTANGTQVIQSTGGTASGQRWAITKVGNAFKVTPKCNTNKVLGLSTDNFASGTSLVSKEYNSTNDYCKWYFSLTVYGRQQFRVLSGTQLSQINCFRYAVMREEEEDVFMSYADAYLSTVSPSTAAENSTYLQQVRDKFAENVYKGFKEWGENNGIIEETDFVNNGKNKILSSNQYRIVLRTGVEWVYDYQYKGYVLTPDYHFWYQTFDGRWANKHGETAPELLGEEDTPFSTDTSGWDYGSIKNFYSSDVHIFTVTLP